MKKLIVYIAFTLTTISAWAQSQNVGINTINPDASAILEVYSEDKGMLIPRMTSAQRLAIANPAHALLVFDTDVNTIYFFDATQGVWEFLTASSDSYWEINGAHLYNTNSGNVGIGTNEPTKKLHLKGDGQENTGIAFTNSDSTKSVIIEIDETNDGFEFIGDNGVEQSSMMYFNEEGKVGYGLTDPKRKLHAQGNGDENVALMLTSADSSYSIIIEIDETNDGFRLLGDNGLEVKELMFIDSDGKMGMGTSNPQKKMHLKSKGSNPASLAFTQEDSSYNVIIEIDETNDGIEFVGDNGTVAKSLMYIDDEGNVGVGTRNPQKKMHVKGTNASPASIALTQEDSTYNVIIEIDETNDGIEFIGDNGTIAKSLMYIDDSGKIGIGTNAPEEFFHLKSDAVNPSMKLTRTGYQYEYSLGFDENSSNFVLERDTLFAGSANILEFDSAGDVTINSSNEINLNSNTVNTTSITLENSTNGASVVLTSDEFGQLDVSGSNTLSQSFVDFNIKGGVVSSSDYPLQFNAYGVDVVSSAFDTIPFNAPSLSINEDGIYNISYSIQIDKVTLSLVRTEVACYINNVLQPQLTYTYTTTESGLHTIGMNRITQLADGDDVRFVLRTLNYSNSNDQYDVVEANSFLNLIKIAN